MEIDTLYTGGKQFKAIARDHVIVVDQPLDDDGSDEGMTPPELFLSSLGTCASYYVVAYLQARSLPCEGLRVRVKGFKGGRPLRIADIELVIESPFEFDARTRQGMETAAQKCLIHETLLNPPHLRIHAVTEARAPVACA